MKSDIIILGHGSGGTLSHRLLDELIVPILSGVGPRDQNDAAVQLPVVVESPREHAGCRCGEILKGQLRPADCPLFRTVCTPEEPVGACMVSSEGTCAAEYKYG